MANNPHVNKVEYGGQTIIDLTGDTVEPGVLVDGYTAHDRSGAPIAGTFVPVTGVKGDAENSYRTGNVNLTPANIGALAPGDVVNNLTSGGTNVPLSAEMGKTLGGRLRIGASERLAYSQTVPANGTLDITLANRATDYSLLVLGKNSYVNNTREGFDGRNNIFIAPGGISATSVYAPLIPPDGSWTAWFLSNTSLHVANGTASDIVFRVDGIR